MEGSRAENLTCVLCQFKLHLKKKKKSTALVAEAKTKLDQSLHEILLLQLLEANFDLILRKETSYNTYQDWEQFKNIKHKSEALSLTQPMGPKRELNLEERGVLKDWTLI